MFDKFMELFKNPLKEKYGKEQVFVIEDDMLCRAGLYPDDELERMLEDNGCFKLRYKMEKNPKYRQIIPYCVLCYKDYVFMTQRLQGDSRLVGKTSIGIGGHINLCDTLSSRSPNVIGNAIDREIAEEVNLESEILDKSLADVIVLSGTEVDSVHVGLVYIIELDGMRVSINETDILTGKWVRIKDLDTTYLENWSRYVYDNILSVEEIDKQ